MGVAFSIQNTFVFLCTMLSIDYAIRGNRGNYPRGRQRKLFLSSHLVQARSEVPGGKCTV